MHYRILILSVLFSTATVSYSQTSSKPLVVGTASIFRDMAAAIGDTLIETASVVPIGGDPHIYEPTPGDVRLLTRADLILQNGLTFEGWIRELIEHSGTKGEVVTITEGISPVQSTAYANAVDPHAWMDPHNGKIYAANIRDALVRLLPQHKTQIETQYNTYIAALDSLIAYVESAVSQIPEARRILITSHDAFQYYGRRFGIRLESVLGTSTDADVRTADLVRLNTVIRESNVPVVFIESTINPKLLQQVAQDNKISIGGKLYSDSLGEEDTPAGTYIGMIRHNTDIIVSGLTSTADTENSTPTSGSGKKLWLVAGGLFLLAGAIIFFFRKTLRQDG